MSLGFFGDLPKMCWDISHNPQFGACALKNLSLYFIQPQCPNVNRDTQHLGVNVQNREVGLSGSSKGVSWDWARPLAEMI